MANLLNIEDLEMTVKDNPEWFTRAFFGGRLISGGYIRAITDVKDGTELNEIGLQNNILQLDGKDCAWTPNQVIKLSGQKAYLKTYKINLEQCIDDLEKRRTIHMMSPGANNEALPPELEDAILMLIAIGLSKEIETMIIGGDSDVNPNEVDGAVKILLSSTESIQLPGVPITAANILTTIASMYAVVPEDVLQNEDAGDLRIFYSYGDRRKAREALTTVKDDTIAKNWSLNDADPKNPIIYYMGIELVPVLGMPKDTMILIDSNNLFMLTDLESDLENIRMGQFAPPLEQKVWIKGRLRLGVAIPFPDEAVIVSPAITDERTPADEKDLRVVPTNLIFSYKEAAAQQFTVITGDTAATIEVDLAEGSGFTVTKGATTAGVTIVTVVPEFDNTSGINPRTAQVVVSLNGVPNRYATVMLEQEQGMATTAPPVIED